MELVAFKVHGMQLFERQHATVTVIYVVGLIMYTFNKSDGSTRFENQEPTLFMQLSAQSC